jgi:tetratricopeptide (TPR) repeat protein
MGKTRSSSLLPHRHYKLAGMMGSEPCGQVISSFIKNITTVESLTRLGNELLISAERNYLLRRIDRVERAGRMLAALPLPEKYRLAAQYYIALCIKRQGNSPGALGALERVADTASPRFRAKAISSLGAIAVDQGDDRWGLELYCEAFKVLSGIKWSDLPLTIQTHRALAVMKSRAGDHRGSLSDLDKLFPLAQSVGQWHPHTYFDYMNSLAVELSETGRIEAACNASRIALASGYAQAYPEWQETLDEIASKARRPSQSIVTVKVPVAPPSNVVLIGAVWRGPRTSARRAAQEETGRKARVLSFKDCKKALRGQPTTPQRKELNRLKIQSMTVAEKQAQLMKFIFPREVDEKLLTNLLVFLKDIEPDKPGNH